MAASAAILVWLPGLALAATQSVCTDLYQYTTLPGRLFPAIDQWINASPDSVQLRSLLQPDTLITGVILIWLIASNGTRSTITAIAWFLCLAIYHAFVYFSIDPTSSTYGEAIALGCFEYSPRYILSNLGFAVVAALLTWQRIRRQKSEAPR